MSYSNYGGGGVDWVKVAFIAIMSLIGIALLFFAICGIAAFVNGVDIQTMFGSVLENEEVAESTAKVICNLIC